MIVKVDYLVPVSIPTAYLSTHSHTVVDGRYVRRPVFWEVDLTGDRLRVIRKL